MRQKYTTQMSVSDLIDIDYSLLQVISRMGLSLKSVSYTHLTLPTILLV